MLTCTFIQLIVRRYQCDGCVHACTLQYRTTLTHTVCEAVVSVAHTCHSQQLKTTDSNESVLPSIATLQLRRHSAPRHALYQEHGALVCCCAVVGHQLLIEAIAVDIHVLGAALRAHEVAAAPQLQLCGSVRLSVHQPVLVVPVSNAKKKDEKCTGTTVQQ
jgi:hypothetical protein